MITLPAVILYYSTLSGTSRQILTPKRYDEHPRIFNAGGSRITLQGSTVHYNVMKLLQETSSDFADTESLREKFLEVLKQIHKEKEEEMVIVDIWCHFGHAYLTNVDEGKGMILIVLF